MSKTEALGTPTRTVGFWMAVPMALLQALNSVRAMLDPEGFAVYMGAPLAASGDTAWVMIYAFRAGFIALLVAALLVRRDLDALKWTALAALVMPLGDAWVAQGAGAGTATIGRHLGIAAYVTLAMIALFIAARPRAR